MDRGPAELELAVEAAWILYGKCISQEILDPLCGMRLGQKIQVEGVWVKRVVRGWSPAGKAARPLDQVGEYLQKARFRRELSA